MHYIPQFVVDRRPLLIWSIIAASALFLVLLIIAAPLAVASGRTVLGLTLYQAFSHLCHQDPDRSFFVAGYKFGVCARCTGLYFGFALTVLIYPLLRPLRTSDTPQRKWLFVAAVPIAFDFALGFFGIWQNTHLSRVATGALLGATAVFYVMPGFVAVGNDWLFKQRKQRNEEIAHPIVLNDVLSEAPSDYSAPYRRI
jgi:uncharacterized membrane protein